MNAFYKNTTRLRYAWGITSPRPNGWIPGQRSRSARNDEAFTPILFFHAHSPTRPCSPSALPLSAVYSPHHAPRTPHCTFPFPNRVRARTRVRTRDFTEHRPPNTDLSPRVRSLSRQRRDVSVSDGFSPPSALRTAHSPTSPRPRVRRFFSHSPTHRYSDTPIPVFLRSVFCVLLSMNSLITVLPSGSFPKRTPHLAPRTFLSPYFHSPP